MQAQNRCKSFEQVHTPQAGGEDRVQVFNASLYEVSPFPFEVYVRGVIVDIIEEIGPLLDLLLTSFQTRAVSKLYLS